MALKIARGKNLPIGLDIGTSKAKLIQLRQNDGAYEVLAADSVVIPPDCRQDFAKRLGFLSESFRTIVKSKTFRGTQCVLSIPAEATLVHHLKLPALSADELPEALSSELNGKLPYSVGNAIIRHVVAGELHGDSDAKQEVITVSVERSVLESYLAMSRRAKLDVTCVNIEPCAVVECFARLFRRATDSARTILFIDMGARTTQVVFSHGSQIVFARNLPIGGDDLDRVIAEGLDVPLEQAIASRHDLAGGSADEQATGDMYRLLDKPLDLLGDEVNTCLRYYESVFPSRSVERAIFIGGQAYDKRLCQSLAQRLNLPAQVGDPLLHIKRTDSPQLNTLFHENEPRPDWAVAVGLSIGAFAAA